jgi:hypothetical protein
MAHKYKIEYIIKIEENDFKIKLIPNIIEEQKQEIDVSIIPEDYELTKRSYKNFKIVQCKNGGSVIYFVKKPTVESNDYIIICFQATKVYDGIVSQMKNKTIVELTKQEDNEYEKDVGFIKKYIVQEYLEPYFKFLLGQSVKKPDFKIKTKRT